MTQTDTHTTSRKQDDYAILGVASDASDETLKAARKRLIKANHPDICGGDPAAAKRLVEINEAFTRVMQRRKAGPIPDQQWARTGPSQKTQRGSARKGSAGERETGTRFSGIWPEFDENHPFYSWARPDPEAERREQERARAEARDKAARAEQARLKAEAARREEARKRAEEERIAREREAEEAARRHASQSYSVILPPQIRQFLEGEKRSLEVTRAYSAATKANDGIYSDPRTFGAQAAPGGGFGGFFSAGHIPESLMISGGNILAYLPEDPMCRTTDFLILPDFEIIPGQGVKLLPSPVSLSFDSWQDVGGWNQFMCGAMPQGTPLSGYKITACQRQGFFKP